MSTYAIVETGSKQYLVKPNAILEVELLPVSDKKQVTLDRVLLVSHEGNVKVGNPVVKGASVLCEHLGDVRGKKVISFRFRRRKNSRRRKGHRQDLLRLLVKEIKSGQ